VAGAKHGRKGYRIEREIVERHRELGVPCFRVPLSGASHYRGSGHDIDLYLFGKGAEPLKAEVKSRSRGQGFTTLENWLDGADLLFLRRNNADPLVVLPWNVYQRFLKNGGSE
jgi:Holliday junction resolvase